MPDGDLPEHRIDRIFSEVGMRSFEVFYSVVEHEGFSEAAQAMNLTQPTISQHVKNLEEALNDSLILRNESGLKLTPLGRICYEKLKSMTAAKADLKEALKDYYGSGQRHLQIAASTIPGEFLLPTYLPRFLSRHLAVTVDIHIDDSQSILNQIDSGDVRWGVVGDRIENSSLNYTSLLVDEMILVGTPGQVDGNVSYDNFHELNYVGRGSQSGTQRAVERQFREAGYDPAKQLDAAVSLGTVQAVRKAVLNGVGVSFLPLCAVAGDLQAGRLSKIDTTFPTIERTFYGVNNRFIGLPPIVKDFEKFLDQDESLRKTQ